MAGAVKYASSPKMSFASPGADFEPILPAFWVAGEAYNEEESVPGGGRKVGFFMAGAIKYASSPKMSFGSPRIDFESILATFWVPGGP